MSKGDALAIDDFERTHFSATHWLDVSKSKCIGKSKKPDPNCLFNIFGELLDCDAHSVRDQAMTEIFDNFNHYPCSHSCVIHAKTKPNRMVVQYAQIRYTRR